MFYDIIYVILIIFCNWTCKLVELLAGFKIQLQPSIQTLISVSGLWKICEIVWLRSFSTRILKMIASHEEYIYIYIFWGCLSNIEHYYYHILFYFLLSKVKYLLLSVRLRTLFNVFHIFINILHEIITVIYSF